MSIKKGQAILKCFIDLKSSVWITLGSEGETMFCDTSKLFSARLPVKVSKTLNDRQSLYSLLSSEQRKPNAILEMKHFRIPRIFLIDI